MGRHASTARVRRAVHDRACPDRRPRVLRLPGQPHRQRRVRQAGCAARVLVAVPERRSLGVDRGLVQAGELLGARNSTGGARQAGGPRFFQAGCRCRRSECGERGERSSLGSRTGRGGRATRAASAGATAGRCVEGAVRGEGPVGQPPAALGWGSLRGARGAARLASTGAGRRASGLRGAVGSLGLGLGQPGDVAHDPQVDCVEDGIGDRAPVGLGDHVGAVPGPAAQAGLSAW
jgi:hypothetical protein